MQVKSLGELQLRITRYATCSCFSKEAPRAYSRRPPGFVPGPGCKVLRRSQAVPRSLGAPATAAVLATYMVAWSLDELCEDLSRRTVPVPGTYNKDGFSCARGA